MELLQRLGLEDGQSGVAVGPRWLEGRGGELASDSPVDGSTLGRVRMASPDEYNEVVRQAQAAFLEWRQTPAPKRGDIVRQIGDAVRAAKGDLGRLISWEVGKIVQEGEGEVQEMIDICDFAVGLSRQLYGLTMASERPGHRMYEQWHPLGPVGVITAFNFPCAVWSWNAMIAAVCGDVVIWKPSPKTPLISMALHRIAADVLKDNGCPEGVFNLVIGSNEAIAEPLVDDARLPLISATGSTRMGRTVAQRVAARLGKFILELGGNNAIIVTPSADLKLSIPGIVFGSVGTCGQRCTTTRRLIVHASIYDEVRDQLVNAYRQLDAKIGSPLESETLIGPMIDESAVASFQAALATIREQGGIVHGGERAEGQPSGRYVRPALAEVPGDLPMMQEETFGPLLYLTSYRELDEALALQNGVPQGLSSAIFTTDLRESEAFLGHAGSDCGIANVNIGTSGAEIGGAFGGEKETGGGRESGSDAWKAYMRRQTNTINYSAELPLAQGIRFELD